MAVYVFPGQGSQKVGMGEGLFDKFPGSSHKIEINRARVRVCTRPEPRK